VAPAKPEKALIPNLGKTCWAAWAGGRSSHLGQEQSCRQRTKRDGGRHPGSRKIGSLRGAPVEHEPRSVHVVRKRILSFGREHRRQRMSGGLPRRGTFVSVRPFKAYAPGARANSNRHLRLGEDTSFSRSSEPVHVNRHYTPTFKRRSVVARPWWYRRRANLREAGGTDAGVTEAGRSAARRSEPLPQGRGRLRVRSGRWSRPSSARGIESSGSCPHVEVVSCRSR
jgi:hypothetical protein